MAVRVTNALLAASLLPLLYSFSRLVLRASRHASFAAALSGALVPAVLAHSSWALAENLVRPLCVATLLACYGMINARHVWQRLGFGPCAALLFVTHERFVLTLLVALVVIVGGRLVRVVPRSIAVGNIGLLVGLLVGAAVVRSMLVEQRWVAGIDTPQGSVGDALDAVVNWSFVGLYVLAWIGQAWYIAVGSLGISVIGIGVIVSRLRTGCTNGPILLRWKQSAATDDTWLTAVFLLASAGAVFIVSTYFFTRVNKPTEGYFAGRHNESFMPIWVAAGVAFLAAGRARRTVLRALGVAAGFVVVTTTILLVVRDREDWSGFVAGLNASAIAFYPFNGRAIVLIPTAVSVAALIIMFAIRAAGTNSVVVLPLALVLVWGVSTGIKPDEAYVEWRLPEDFAELGIDRAAIVQSRGAGTPIYYQYFLSGLEAVTWNGTGSPPAPFVFASVDDERVQQRGARLLLIDEGVVQGFAPPYAMGVWVMPGPQLDEYRNRGQLLPTPVPP